MNNIKYANFDATDERKFLAKPHLLLYAFLTRNAEVYEACRAASIHEKITSFPDGYLSKVGERGVKLSGGELQRVCPSRGVCMAPMLTLFIGSNS